MIHYRHHHYGVTDDIVLGCKIIYLFSPSTEPSTASLVKKN